MTQKKLAMLGVLFVCAFSSQALDIAIQSQAHEAMNILIGLMDDDATIAQVADHIAKDLAFRNQFKVTIQPFKRHIAKQEISQLAQQHYPLALFLSHAPHGHIEWRLYDTRQVSLLGGKKYTKRGTEPRYWAHNIADTLTQQLTSHAGSFSTKIAYCKDIPLANGRHYKHIYIADYDGTHAQPLIATPTINIAPRWNNDPENPLLFFSECTKSNVRLLASDMNKRRRVVSNFDGLNMLPAFSHDGKRVVYCASRGDGNCQLYFYQKGQFKKLTSNTGTNISPTMSADGNLIYFCSDFETHLPQIYCFNLTTQECKRITDGGYCASPSLSPSTGKLAYTKTVKGVNQLFVYDTNTGTHTQLTTDDTHKEECSWSECGTYLLFCLSKGSMSRIALLDVLSGKVTCLTPEHERCSYPAWSPSYIQVPVVAG